MAAFLVAPQSAAQESSGIYLALSRNTPTGAARDGLALSLTPPQQPIYPGGQALVTIELRNVSKKLKRIYIDVDQGRTSAHTHAEYAFTIVNRETGKVIPINHAATSGLVDAIRLPVTAHQLSSKMSTYARFDHLTYFYPLIELGTYSATVSTWVGTGSTGVSLQSNPITITVRGGQAQP